MSIDRKSNKFKTFGTAAAITIVIIAWILVNKFINFILYIIEINIYYL